MTLGGYWLGSSIHNVDHYLLPIIAVVIVVSLLPLLAEVLRSRRHRTVASPTTAARDQTTDSEPGA